jgi:hypothetical protein
MCLTLPGVPLLAGAAPLGGDGTGSTFTGSPYVHRQDDIQAVIHLDEQPGCCGQPFWYYRPDRYIGRHRKFGGEHDLRYYQHYYPFDRDDYLRRTYPHTYSGQFGDPPGPDRLRGHFYYGPGYSPFSRDGGGYDTSPDAMYYPEFQGPGSPAPAPAAPQELQPRGPDIVVKPLPPAPGLPRRDRPDSQVFEALEAEAASAPHRQAELADYERAWRMLGSGRLSSSQYAFSSLALMRPDEGMPRAGYAISMALQGDFVQAVWGMRRAFRADRHWRLVVPENAAVEHRLHGLATRLGHDAPEGMTRTDAFFMLAAVHYLRRDFEAAEQAVMSAIERGDRDLSVLVLRSLIHRGDVQPRVPASPLGPGRPSRPRRELDA